MLLGGRGWLLGAGYVTRGQGLATRSITMLLMDRGWLLGAGLCY